MGERYRVAEVDEFEGDGSRIIADVEGLEIAVFRIDGEFHAIANYCVHQGGPLCAGGLGGRMVADAEGDAFRYDDEETYVSCPWHGWMFDVTTGECIDADRYRTPAFDVEAEDGTVYVLR